MYTVYLKCIFFWFKGVFLETFKTNLMKNDMLAQKKENLQFFENKKKCNKAVILNDIDSKKFDWLTDYWLTDWQTYTDCCM